VLLLVRCSTAHAAGVVGTGSAASCDDAALDAALFGGGLVTFDCGPEAVTIQLTAEKTITAENAETIVDGAGLITLNAEGSVRAFNVNAGATLQVRRLTVSNGGRPLSGGGIYNEGNLMVTDCTVANNRAVLGGGISNRGLLVVVNSTFSGNSAGFGGGIYNEGTATISNSTLAANAAVRVAAAPVGNGGGIANSGILRVINCTIANNGASAGGGVFNIAAPGISNTLTITNTIIANNSGGDCISFEGSTDGTDNLIRDAVNSCGIVNGVDGHIVGVDPMLDPAGLRDNGGASQTIALLPDGPAIDAGDPIVCANPPVNGVDQRGHVRPGPGSVHCSIGAFEYSFSDPLTTPTDTPTVAPSGTPTPTSTAPPSATDTASRTPSPSPTVSVGPSTATRAATPTSTTEMIPSPSSTATAPPSDGGDGCTMSSGHNKRSAWFLLASAIALVGARRRKKER
jgi:hypothetical protein